MRLINRQSFPRWIHWFWITGIILSTQPHLLRSQETSSSSLTATTTASSESSSSSEKSNISVSHTISVVSVLYSSDEETPSHSSSVSSTTINPVQISNSSTTESESRTTSVPPTTPSTTTTLKVPTSTLKEEEETTPSTTTAASKPLERLRGGKEGRSLMVHAPVVVRVFDKKEDTSSEEGEKKNASSSVEVISEVILREKSSTLLELGETHGSLLTLQEHGNEQPSMESTASGMSTNTLIGIIMGILVLMIIGTVAFGVLIYHEKFANKPQTLDDNYAHSDSGGIYNFSTTEDFFRRISHIECGGFDIGRDTYSEEMYNLDNDSFLNSLEAMTFPSYSPDMNNRSTFSNDSGV